MTHVITGFRRRELEGCAGLGANSISIYRRVLSDSASYGDLRLVGNIDEFP